MCIIRTGGLLYSLEHKQERDILFLLALNSLGAAQRGSGFQKGVYFLLPLQLLFFYA